MQIKNIFFPLPVVVDLINENGEEERKLIFYDQTNNSFLPLDNSIPSDQFESICQEILENIDYQDENNYENLPNITDLSYIEGLAKKVKDMKAGNFDKFGKTKF
jgi:hypothetical protein